MKKILRSTLLSFPLELGLLSVDQQELLEASAPIMVWVEDDGLVRALQPVSMAPFPPLVSGISGEWVEVELDNPALLDERAAIAAAYRWLADFLSSRPSP